MSPTAPMYPDLQGSGSVFRLHKISDFEKILKLERDNRESLYKKYHRGVNIIDGITTTSSTIAIVSGATGIGLLATGVGMPVGVALESVAVVSGIVNIVGRIVNKRLAKKAEKHDRIRQTADTTLRTLSDIVSKALRDGEINETEYVQVVDEMDRYNEIKEEIRKETRKALTNIDTMLEKARKEGKEEGVKLERQNTLKKLKAVSQEAGSSNAC